MKSHTLPLVSLLLGSVLLTGACTKSKQMSQQPNENSTMTDARPDLANQPSPVSEAKGAKDSPSANANPHLQQGPVTTNPNSARGTTDSTINTSAGAAVVGKSNMNPRAEGESGKTPTSIDTSNDREPLVSAAIDKMDCRDAPANHFANGTAPKLSTCTPFNR